jgi:hypothetical protein
MGLLMFSLKSASRGLIASEMPSWARLHTISSRDVSMKSSIAPEKRSTMFASREPPKSSRAMFTEMAHSGTPTDMT